MKTDGYSQHTLEYVPIYVSMISDSNKKPTLIDNTYRRLDVKTNAYRQPEAALLVRVIYNRSR